MSQPQFGLNRRGFVLYSYSALYSIHLPSQHTTQLRIPLFHLEKKRNRYLSLNKCKYLSIDMVPYRISTNTHAFLYTLPQLHMAFHSHSDKYNINAEIVIAFDRCNERNDIRFIRKIRTNTSNCILSIID